MLLLLLSCLVFCVLCLSYADFDLFNKQKAPKYKKPQEETLPSSAISVSVCVWVRPRSVCPSWVCALGFGLALSPFGFAYGNNSIMHNKDAV